MCAVVCGCKCDEIISTCLVWTTWSTPKFLAARPTDSILPQGSRKGSLSHYTDSELANQLPNSLVPNASHNLRANLSVFMSFVWHGWESNPIHPCLSGCCNPYEIKSRKVRLDSIFQVEQSRTQKSRCTQCFQNLPYCSGGLCLDIRQTLPGHKVTSIKFQAESRWNFSYSFATKLKWYSHMPNYRAEKQDQRNSLTFEQHIQNKLKTVPSAPSSNCRLAD